MKNRTRLNVWRVIICYLSFCCITSFLSAQTTVIKRSAMKSNDFGVTYFLPKTKIVVQVEMTKVTQKAGPYAVYASKNLGINNAILEDNQYYTLDNITAKSVGIPDKEKEYLVMWNSKTVAPFLSLTEDGIICAINAVYEFPPKENTNPPNESPKKSKISGESLLTEEYFRAGSTAKMAEVLSKQIYKIRESRSDIITGESDNAPRDGAALKLVLEQLDNQEQALLELFRGTSSEEKLVRQYEFEPVAEMEKEVIFRFSKHFGMVKADDLSGNPVYLNLTNTDPGLSSGSDRIKKQQTAKKSPAIKGVVYNLPGQANVEMYYGTTLMFNGTFPVVQFGDTELLAPNLLEEKRAISKIYFYPETGAINRIVQTGVKR